MIATTAATIRTKIAALKKDSGSHSPSIATMLREIPELKIKVDACFLSNPYATEHFINHLQTDLIDNHKIREVLEFYPPQNSDVAASIAAVNGVAKECIFVGNGAIEVIQAVIHRFAGSKLSLPLPTFSSYYEYATEDHEVAYFPLQKEEGYKININDYLEFIEKEGVDTAILINPNNPNGWYASQSELRHFIGSLQHLKMVIIDESFVHFAYENDTLEPVSIEPWIAEFPNLVVIKSMSKDFGIAGLRAGYGVMSAARVSALLANGYLWNISGLTDYFFKLYSTPAFREEYEVHRVRYIKDTVSFLKALEEIEGIRAYPSKANFGLIEIQNGLSSSDFSMNMLCKYGVYVRDCSDKIGLEGAFVRIAARSAAENKLIVEAIKGSLSPAE